MKKTCIAVLCFLPAIAVLAAQTKHSVYKDRPCVVAAQGNPSFDEESEILWDGFDVLELKAFSSPYDPELKTWAQVGCSEVGIGIVFWCSEPGIIRNPAFIDRDEPPWDGDCFEVMLSPGGDDPKDYYHIAVTPGSALLPSDSGAEDRSRPYDSFGHDESWNCNGLIVITCPWEKKGWKGIIVVPYESLGIERRFIPKLWRLNLSRSVPPSDERSSADHAWNVGEGESPHDGSQFGYVVVPAGRGVLPEDLPGPVQELAPPAEDAVEEDENAE